MKASALFRATFGVAPRAAASAPGRVNLIGEHTDYNGGPVLPVALGMRTTVVAGPAEAGVLEVVSTRDAQLMRLDPRDHRAAGWAAYVAGVWHELAAAGGERLAGARVAGAGDVPAGAGLASSRGAPVATAKALPRPLRARAVHVVSETARTRFGAQLLARGRLKQFGRLLYESHESCRRLYECSAAELDLVVAAAKRAGALGARLTGAGWGGAVLVLVERKREARITAGIRGAFARAYGREPPITVVRAAGGVRRESVR